ncbi:MAG: hypothetical protein ACTHJS_17570 [Xanthobacteraceae bacterium]
MRTFIKSVVALSFISAAAIGTTATVQAQGVYFDAPGVHVGVGGYPYRHRYYDYYGGGTWNGCPPGWTWQGGNCAPYQGPRGGPHLRHWYGYR